MSGKRSRDKGKRGELEVAKYATKHGYPGRRGQQRKGGPDSPDVIVESWPGTQVEVKRAERLNVYEAMKKCAEDAGADQIPEVWWRKNNEEWLVIRFARDDMLYKDAYYGASNTTRRDTQRQHFPPQGE